MTERGIDRADAVVVWWSPAEGSPRRLRFEPRHDGDWTRFDEVWTGCVWRVTGTETVSGLGFENVPPECAAPV